MGRIKSICFILAGVPQYCGFMYSIKPGRGPSGLNAISGIVAVVFGIFWTILACAITHDAPSPVGVIFPVFGVLFVIIGIVKVIYNASNATRENRFSSLDITTDLEEPDPLNQIVNRTAGRSETSAGVENRLKEIDQLRAKGIISSEEHAAQRECILREI